MISNSLKAFVSVSNVTRHLWIKSHKATANWQRANRPFHLYIDVQLYSRHLALQMEAGRRRWWMWNFRWWWFRLGSVFTLCYSRYTLIIKLKHMKYAGKSTQSTWTSQWEKDSVNNPSPLSCINWYRDYHKTLASQPAFSNIDTIHSHLQRKLHISIRTNLRTICTSLRTIRTNLRTIRTNLRTIRTNLRTIRTNLRTIRTNLRTNLRTIRTN